MNILQVTHYFGSHIGGIEAIAAALGEQFAASGHEVSWAAFDEPEGRRHRSERIAYLGLTGSNSIERLLGLPYPLLSLSSIRAVYRAAREADVVHVHDCAYLACAAAALGARASSRPLFVSQQIGLVPYRSAAMRIALDLLYRTIGRFVLASAHKVTFANEDVMKYFRRFVRFRSPPLVTPNGVDSSIFRPAGFSERREFRRRHRPRGFRRCALFVGRFTEKKGMSEIRSAARTMTDVGFVLAGWGDQDPRRWGLPNVHVRFKVPQPELRELYNAADLLVLPSRGEGAPLVVYEALSSGLPCLVSEEVARAFPEARGLLLTCPADGASLADAIAGFFSSVRGRRKLAREIRRRDIPAWDWKARAGELLKMFEAELEKREDR